MSCHTIGSKRRLVSKYGPLAEAFIRNYMDDAVERTFGIRFKNGKFMIGNKIMKIQGNNIVIDHEVYIGKPRLWTLITGNNPMKMITRDTNNSFTKPMCSTVTMLLKVVNPRANRSTKWNKILHPIWGDFSMKELHPPATRLTRRNTSAQVVFVLCICSFNIRRIGN